MTLRERLDADLKTAMREKDQLRLSTIRMVKSAMKYKETEAGAKGPLDDTAILAVITSEIKKRRDSVTEYEKAERKDLAEKEQAEIAVLSVYLPPQLSESELDSMIDGAIAEAGAEGLKDLGKVMKLLTPKTQGRADGKVVADRVKAKLQG